MIEEYNGCIEEETHKVYAIFQRLAHIHSHMMYVEEGEEYVQIGFNLHGTEYVGVVTPQSGVVELYQVYGIITDGMEEKPNMGLHGFCEVYKLVELLNSVPHINDIMIDMGCGKENIH